MISQTPPFRFVTANCVSISHNLRRRAGMAALAMALSFAPCASAIDVVLPLIGDTTPIVEFTTSEEPVPGALEIDRDVSNRLTRRPIVDFDIDSAKEIAANVNEVAEKASKKKTTTATATAKEKASKPASSKKAGKEKSASADKTTSASKVPPFSTAFTDALKDIAASNKQLIPTPARDASDALDDTSTGLQGLKNAVKANVTDASDAEAAAKLAKSTKKKLDLATEVAPPAVKTPTKPTVAIKKEPIAPSVASRKPAAVARRKSTPLKVDLEQYFDGLEKKPTPEVEKKEYKNAATPAPVSNFPTETVPRFQYREPGVVISRRMAALQPKISKTLRYYYDRPLNTRDDSAWSVMHSFLGYGPGGMVALNSERGQRTNAVQWMCQNGPLMGRRLFYLENGYIKGVEGAGYQGHPCQFLAMLAQIGIPRDYPMNIQGRQLDVEDLVNSEMYTCSTGMELTFKLIAFSHYLNSDATWKSETGETWTIPDVLTTEMAQPVNGAACGGTHRIMAISFAVRNRELRGEPIDGVYLQAQQYVRQYQRYIMSLQNRDGSFSTDWLKGRADNGDKDRQLQTTGHMLEWLVYSLPRNELSDPRVVKAAEFLTDLMSRNRRRDWEVGPRGHAIRALSLYYQRVFERPTAPRVATKPVR